MSAHSWALFALTVLTGVGFVTLAWRTSQILGELRYVQAQLNRLDRYERRLCGWLADLRERTAPAVEEAARHGGRRIPGIATVFGKGG